MTSWPFLLDNLKVAVEHGNGNHPSSVVSMVGDLATVVLWSFLFVVNYGGKQLLL